MNTMKRIIRQNLREALIRQAVDRKIEDRLGERADNPQEATRNVSGELCKSQRKERGTKE